MSEAWEPQLPPAAHPAKVARGFPVGLTIATAIALAILIALGVWQLQRLKWKEGLLAHIAALQNAPAQALEPVLNAAGHGRDVGYTRVSVVCPGLAKAPFLEVYALREGEIGSRLVSACPATSLAYRSVLVDRGFVPDTVSARPPVDPTDTTPVILAGVLRYPDKPSFVSPANRPETNRWYTRDIAAMARALGAPQPAPAMLFAETATNPEWKALTPAPVPTDIPNRHFEYALTWFGLAAGLAGVYLASLLARRKV